MEVLVKNGVLNTKSCGGIEQEPWKYTKIQKTQRNTSKQANLERMLAKGKLYQLAARGSAIIKAKPRTQNPPVMKKFLKTAYFMTRKKWAVREDFEDITALLQDLGDEEVKPVKSVDSFLKCLSSHFNLN